MKKIRLENEDEGIPSTALREISVLRSLDHEQIVKLTDVQHTLTPPRLYLVFEWVDCDLKKFMQTYTSTEEDEEEKENVNYAERNLASQGRVGTKKKQKGLPPSLVQSLMYQLLLGLDYCHSRGVFHRDLKPQNLLVTGNGTLKIADFGLARTFCVPFRNFTHEVVTLWYRAPEVLLGEKRYALPIDMWSVGTIFAEMTNRRPLLPGDCEIDELYRIFRCFGTPTDEVWPGVTKLRAYNLSFPKWKKKPIEKLFPALSSPGLDLMSNLFEYKPWERISARSALDHPYFQKDLPKAK